jgi:HK97 gp10 family phage protein
MVARYKLNAGDLKDGLRRLAEETTGATARNAARRGLLKAAQPMVARAKALAAHDPDYAESIEAGVTLKNNLGDAAYATAKRGGASDEAAVAFKRQTLRRAKGTEAEARVFVGGTGPKGALAHLGEFGTKPHRIEVREARGKKTLSFPGADGDVAMGAGVDHPGEPPRPVIRPAFEETKEEVRGLMIEEVRDQVQKAAARAARKRARKAAKG